MAAKTHDVGFEGRWDDVRVFLAAYRQLSLGAAGARLGLDTATVSPRLTRFEAGLGARLFERTRAGLVPTRRAARVLPAAESMEAALGRLAREASGLDDEPEGVVRLSAAPGEAEMFIAPALARLRARYPKVRVEPDASPRARDLARGEADLALRSARPRGAELVVTKLASARWVAAGAPEFVRGFGRLEAWGAAPWVGWDADLATFGPARWLARHAAGADVALRTNHFSAQLAAAEARLGLVLAPEPYLRARRLDPARYAERLRPSAADWPVDDLWLVGHRALREVPRVAALWSFLADELRRALSAPPAGANAPPPPPRAPKR